MANPSIWKIALAAGIGLALIAFILGWIAFSVPNWQGFQRYNNSVPEYYGLWAYCQQQAVFYNSVCRRWPDAQTQLFNGSRPNFVSTSEGLITTGMILLSIGLIGALFALILPVLAYLAGILAFLAFLFLVIGVPIFGTQSNNLSALQNAVTYGKLYGFGLMIATLVLEFVAAVLFFIAGFLYQKFGFGNFATKLGDSNKFGGQRLLGPPNMMNTGLYGGPMNPYAPIGVPQTSLLSQYIAQRMPRYYSPPIITQAVVSALPQPSIVQTASRPMYVTPTYYTSSVAAQPAYYTAPVAAQPAYMPLVNLTGRTLAGPVIRVS